MMVGNAYTKFYIVLILTVEAAALSVNKMKIMYGKLNIYTKFYSVDTSGCRSNA